MTTTIYLIRHGEYENPKNIIPQRLPGFPLNSNGRQQAFQNARLLKSKKKLTIYSSPILRCKQTAQIISRQLKQNVYYSNLILEVRTPIQGMNSDTFFKLNTQVPGFPYSYHIHLKKHGETISEIYQRVYKFISKIINKHLEENIIVVFHGDPIMILIYGLVDKNYNLMLYQTRTYIPKGGIAKLTFLGRKLIKFEEINY